MTKFAKLKKYFTLVVFMGLTKEIIGEHPLNRFGTGCARVWKIFLTSQNKLAYRGDQNYCLSLVN